jgi:hypothetical protein
MREVLSIHIGQAGVQTGTKYSHRKNIRDLCAVGILPLDIELKILWQYCSRRPDIVCYNSATVSSIQCRLIECCVAVNDHQVMCRIRFED